MTKRAVMEQLNQKRIKYNWHEADVSVIEGVLARGDRRLANAIELIYQKGCMFDSWTEYFKNDIWLESMAECGLEPAFYTTRERSLDEIFPWDFLDCGVTKEFLIREWKKALNEEISLNCAANCQGCGASKYGVGICTADKGGKIDIKENIVDDADILIKTNQTKPKNEINSVKGGN